MGDWEEVRDWEVNESVFDLQHDSYDFVGRDIPLKQGIDAGMLRYRTQNYSVEAGFFYSTEDERAEAMEDLELARDVLEGHYPRLYLVDSESVRIGDRVDLEGNYVFDSGSDVMDVVPHLEDFMRVSFESSEVEPLRCKR